jgi:hypothetical protein
MVAMDACNRRWGRGAVGAGHRRASASQYVVDQVPDTLARYTTRVDEPPVISGRVRGRGHHDL